MPSARKPIFHPEFLTLSSRYLEDLEPIPAEPLQVVKNGDKFVLIRSSNEEHIGAFQEESMAHLVALVVPPLETPPMFRFQSEGTGILRAKCSGLYDSIGKVRYREPEIPEALHLLDWIIRSPAALASLLRATKPNILAMAGRLLAEEAD